MTSNTIKWIVQKNLIKPSLLAEFRAAFAELQIDFEEITVIPFSQELPEFSPADVNVFYGSSTLMLNAWEHPRFRNGLFFNPHDFTIENYLKRWGNKMLNSDGIIAPLGTFVEKLTDSEVNWFLRPNGDDKSFSGMIMSTSDIRKWYSSINSGDSPIVNSDVVVLGAPVKEIVREWRNFIVNCRVVDSSRYMLNGQKDVSREDVPKEMIDFAENCAREYSPHRIFVLDVAETRAGYKIIECNCFNGTGFYDNDVKEIVSKVTAAAK
ncbi:ATP-grasp domain-containing protein [Chryseolinea sp. T2]|uniref:ATP-grasp domain-containing protein n=1 Tax=Chryseolinea sp. T2 TaxID=3129255 RepID=UPI003076A370